MRWLRNLFSGHRIRRVTDFTQCEHPVLLLYGFGATRRTVHILERRLRKDGFCVFSLNLGGLFDTFNTKSVEESAKLVSEKVERLCKRYNLKKVSIVGHSKGGLIGRYYVQFLDGKKYVRKLITLACAHHGNPWAVLGLVSPFVLLKSIRQMTPLSPFLKQLNQAPFPEEVPMVSIFSEKDRICPPRSARLKIPAGANHLKNIQIRNISHPDFVVRKDVYEVISKELLEEESPSSDKA